MFGLKQIFSSKSVIYDGFLAYSTDKKRINSAIPAIHTASFHQNLTASHLSSYALLILLVLCQEKEILTDFVLFPLREVWAKKFFSQILFDDVFPSFTYV